MTPVVPRPTTVPWGGGTVEKRGRKSRRVEPPHPTLNPWRSGGLAVLSPGHPDSLPHCPTPPRPLATHATSRGSCRPCARARDRRSIPPPSRAGRENRRDQARRANRGPGSGGGPLAPRSRGAGRVPAGVRGAGVLEPAGPPHPAVPRVGHGGLLPPRHRSAAASDSTDSDGRVLPLRDSPAGGSRAPRRRRSRLRCAERRLRRVGSGDGGAHLRGGGADHPAAVGPLGGGVAGGRLLPAARHGGVPAQRAALHARQCGRRVLLDRARPAASCAGRLAARRRGSARHPRSTAAAGLTRVRGALALPPRRRRAVGTGGAAGSSGGARGHRHGAVRGLRALQHGSAWHLRGQRRVRFGLWSLSQHRVPGAGWRLQPPGPDGSAPARTGPGGPGQGAALQAGPRTGHHPRAR